ncbi:YbaK/EbsC family protein [Mesorhizobium sp. NBSH29]|uniref:YbaK/EbsC family protein n=1 Tax=Mesorhizobium sp. NBSH29 TaxID=2654249 RepID=UPI0018964DD5|nr:YbaK/EbsC family protein [Mesorhizobium sp. NBSH29]QPC87740.1 YbaK/EbsC family protein [Mesorhizobium sp. NBSH29]
MAGSIDRVITAAAAAGLEIEVQRMGASTRTAQEAAEQCGCDVAQIVKSLIFRGETSGKLFLFLVSGIHQLDLAKAAALAGEPLTRADPRQVRDETGFAIGGVAPIGHLIAMPTFMDETLLNYAAVWSAAGAHDAVFSAAPDRLLIAAKAKAASLEACACTA